MDIYLVDFGDNGVEVPVHREEVVAGRVLVGCGAFPTYVRIARSLRGAELSSTIAHEMMHVSQAAYGSKACTSDYKFLTEATATWAEDYVHHTDDIEHVAAPDFLESPDKSLEDSMAKNGSQHRQYGAYLFFQYLVQDGGGAQIVRQIWEATAKAGTALGAIDAVLSPPGRPDGFKVAWARFAVALYNRDPVATRSFKLWDNLADGAKLAFDMSGDLGGVRELHTGDMDLDINNLSIQYYRFTFADPGTRSLLFYNGFFDQIQAGKAIAVQAMWKDEAGVWQQEIWSKYEFVGLCRDLKNQRVSELVIIISNGEFTPSGGGKLTASKKPYLERSSLGCFRYAGTARMHYKHPTWTGMGRGIEAMLSFEIDPRATGLEAQHPKFPNTLRVGLSTIMILAGDRYTFEEHYSTTGCAFTAGPASFSIGRSPPLGALFTNPFQKLKCTAPSLQTFLDLASGVYEGNAVDTQQITVAVTGPGCHGTEMDFTGNILLTNSVKDGVIKDPPVAQPNGDLQGTFTLSHATFDWLLSPQREP